MAGPSSRYQLISADDSLETSITSSTSATTVASHTAPLDATQLTVTIISSRACTLAIQVRDDAGTWSTAQSESASAATNVYVYPGNFGPIRVVVTVGSSSAWDLQVYAQAS